MVEGHKIEIFSAGCNCCTKAIDMVQDIAGNKDKVIILDMNEPSVIERAVKLNIRSVPTILIDEKIADCCSNRGPDKNVIQSALKH
ncbi:MAG TPA: thioredoxin family protein [Gammaproteobacteria bacterium]|nr:thioredoxin family protein [Gammaproteobacteria bacterium]